MSDIPDPEAQESAAPAPLAAEPARSAARQEPAAAPEIPDRERPPTTANRSQRSAPLTASEPAVATTTAKISISTNAAIGLLGALVTLFGGVMIALLVHTLNTTSSQLNSLGHRITTVEARLSGDIDALDTKLSGDIDALDTKLSGEIDALDAKFSSKIDALEAKLSGDIDALDTRLSSKIDALDAKFSSKIDALARQQADTEETLSVLIAVLNARKEVDAAKAHEITDAATP